MQLQRRRQKRQWKRWFAQAVLAGGMLLAGGCARDREVYRAGLQEESLFEMEQETESAAAEVPETEQETEAPSIIYVYVCGAVRSPGVCEMRSGMRVYEAIALAGGFAEDADEQWLNQAGEVYDGQKLYVYTTDETRQMEAEAAAIGQTLDPATAGQTGDATSGIAGVGETGGAVSQIAGVGQAGGSAPGMKGGGQAASGAAENLVNLNTATREELMTLPGIGGAKADAILEYREEHGSFTSIEEIQNISGIKSAVFSKIEDRITVG